MIWRYRPGDDWRPPPVFYPPGLFVAAIVVIAACWLIYLLPQ